MLDSYFSRFDKVEYPSHPVSMEPNFTEPKRIESNFPISSDEPTEGKTLLAVAWKTGSVLNDELMLGLEILNHMLLLTQGAPLKEAIIKGGIGKDVSSSLDQDFLEPVFRIRVKGSEPDKIGQLEKTIQEVIIIPFNNHFPHLDIGIFSSQWNS